jgi:gliding motility-associated-like protein
VGTYTVIIQDKNGCEVSRDFEVTGPPELETQQVRIVDEVCSSDDNGLIEYTITGGTPPYSYALGDDPTNFITLSDGTLLLDNLDGGFYEIIIQDANDCEPISEDIYVEVKVGSNLTSTIETLNECKDGLPFYTASVVFEDEDLDITEIVYVLDDATPDNPDVSNSSSTTIFENISAGDHTISIVHLGTGCVEAKPFNIEAQDALTLTALEGEINQILVEAQGGDGQYMYYFDDIASSENFYYINTTGNYTVRVVDGKGCEATIEVPLEYIDIEIPNFFTPDGDGYKDKWVIKNSEGFPDMYVKIYDRYGRTIKEFIGQGEWDGSYNQVDMPTGDYWYILKLNGPRDDREFVGHFTVYR